MKEIVILTQNAPSLRNFPQLELFVILMSQLPFGVIGVGFENFKNDEIVHPPNRKSLSSDKFAQLCHPLGHGVSPSPEELIHDILNDY